MATKFSAKVSINDLGLLSLKVSQEDFDTILKNHRQQVETGRIVLTDILVDEDKEDGHQPA